MRALSSLSIGYFLFVCTMLLSAPLRPVQNDDELTAHLSSYTNTPITITQQDLPHVRLPLARMVHLADNNKALSATFSLIAQELLVKLPAAKKTLQPRAFAAYTRALQRQLHAFEKTLQHNLAAHEARQAIRDMKQIFAYYAGSNNTTSVWGRVKKAVNKRYVIGGGIVLLIAALMAYLRHSQQTRPASPPSREEQLPTPTRIPAQPEEEPTSPASVPASPRSTQPHRSGSSTSPTRTASRGSQAHPAASPPRLVDEVAAALASNTGSGAGGPSAVLPAFVGPPLSDSGGTSESDSAFRRVSPGTISGSEVESEPSFFKKGTKISRSGKDVFNCNYSEETHIVIQVKPRGEQRRVIAIPIASYTGDQKNTFAIENWIGTQLDAIRTSEEGRENNLHLPLELVSSFLVHIPKGLLSRVRRKKTAKSQISAKVNSHLDKRDSGDGSFQ